MSEDGVRLRRSMNKMFTLFKGCISIFQLLYKKDKIFKLFCRLTVIAFILRDSVNIIVSLTKRIILLRGIMYVLDMSDM